MTLQFEDIRDFAVSCRGEICGKVKDVYFDDLSCLVRYFVIDTSRWLPGKKVLIRPEVITEIDEERSIIALDVSQQDLENAPPLDEHVPVSRQHEEILHNFFDWPPYWGVVPELAGGWFPYPGYSIDTISEVAPRFNHEEEWTKLREARIATFDQNLRSCKEVCGYGIETKDGETFGSVYDILIDEEEWLVVDFVLSNHKWIPGDHFVCSPLFITNFDESNRRIHVALEREALLSSPRFDPDTYGDEYRKKLISHYIHVYESGLLGHPSDKAHQVAL